MLISFDGAMAIFLTMLNLDTKQLAAVTRAALTHAASDHRWVRAIERGAVELETNPWIEVLEDGHTLLIASPSGNAYVAGVDTCQCIAYTFHDPCWHIGAAGLYQRYLERNEMTNAEKLHAMLSGGQLAFRSSADMARAQVLVANLEIEKKELRERLRIAAAYIHYTRETYLPDEEQQSLLQRYDAFTQERNRKP